MSRFGLIIGCFKSGTTSLYQYLTQHPEISACREKEPNFFASDEHWQRGMDWYRGLWPPDAGPILMEGTMLYTWTPMLPNAAERIASIDEDFRFLYIMRDPIERAESHIMYSASRGYVYPDDPVGDQWLMEVSKYAKQLDEYASRFGRDRLHLLTLEALKENPKQELKRACEFLGIQSNVAFDTSTRHNPTKEKTVNGPVWNWLRDFGGLRALVRQIPRSWRGKVRHLVNPTAEQAEDQYALTPDQRRRFLEALSDDLHRLEHVYGLDISRWNLSPNPTPDH
jgi:hypothetical protein